MEAIYRSKILPIAPAATRRAFAGAILVILCLAAMLVAERRLVGALEAPLSSASLAALGLSSVFATVAARLLSPEPRRTITILTVPLPSDVWTIIPPIAIAISVWLPGSPIVGIAIFWLAIVAEEIWAWRHRSLGDGQSRIENRKSKTVSSVQPPTRSPVPVSAPHFELTSPDSPESEWSDTALCQRLNYREGTDGAIIEGWFRVRFNSAERTAVVHVAFCPAFHTAPAVEAEPLDGFECEIRPTTVLPWGIRWEVRRPASQIEAAETIVGFVARSPA